MKQSTGLEIQGILNAMTLIHLFILQNSPEVSSGKTLPLSPLFLYPGQYSVGILQVTLCATPKPFIVYKTLFWCQKQLAVCAGTETAEIHVHIPLSLAHPPPAKQGGKWCLFGGGTDKA